MELNKIYCEDCRKTMTRMPDNFMDLILIDPPYNISKKNNNRDRSKLDSPIMRRNKAINYDFGDWDNIERNEFLNFTKVWLKECCRILKNGGTIISFFSKEDISYLGWVAKEYNIRTRVIFTWYKTNPVSSFRKVNYLSACEFIWMGSKGDKAWTFNFYLQKEMHNFYKTPNSSAYSKTNHPTEKPIDLIRHFIKIHTNKNDLIYDGFMGSGTTAIACLMENRNFIGSEISAEYCKIANRRIKNYKSQYKLW